MPFAQYYRDYGPMMDGWDHNNWAALVFSLVFLVLVVLVAYYVVRALSGNHTARTDYREPLDIARERYAKGDITKDEFTEIKKELK